MFRGYCCGAAYEMSKNFFIQERCGQSLIEIVIALALFIALVASLASLLMGSYAGLNRSADINKAEGLTQEAISAIQAIRNRAWNELIFSRSAITINNNQWEVIGESTTEQIGKFSRIIDFIPVYRDSDNELVDASELGAWLDPVSQQVVVTISWQTDNKQDVSLTKTTQLSNWQARIWQQSDWSGGQGQANWTEDNKYLSDDGNLEISTPGEISLAALSTSTKAMSGYIVSSAFQTSDLLAYSSLSWEDVLPLACGSCLVKLQIKTAPDVGGSPGAWSATWCGGEGEDGDETDFFTISKGELIHIDHNRDEWIQYKVTLIGDGTYTPTVEEISIYYQ